MLASIPASILNHIRRRTGIPPDSIKPENALDERTTRLRRTPQPRSSVATSASTATRPTFLTMANAPEQDGMAKDMP